MPGRTACERSEWWLERVAALAPADWVEVLPVLVREYPAPFWTFADSPAR